MAANVTERRRCATFHGNCVLIPDAIARKVGVIDPAFRHYVGDIDYGFRAGRAGFEIWLAPGFAGTCARGEKPCRPMPRLREALAELRGPKGLQLSDATLVSFAEWWRFANRHGGALRLVYFLWPYRRLLRCLRVRG